MVSGYLATIDWSCINTRNNIDELFTTFYKTLNKIINKHAPIKTLSQGRIKQFSKPSITKGIRIKEKKTRFYQIGDQDKNKYYRNKICSRIRWSKKQYYCSFFNDNLNNNMKKQGRH